METLHRKRNSFNPSLKNGKYKFLYVVLDIYLGIGVISLLASILYLLLNINQADKIIYYCVPGFVIFLSAAILYLVGYQNILWKKNSKKDD